MRRRAFLAGALSAGTVAITKPATAQTEFLSLKDFIALRLCPPGRTYVRRDVNALLAQDPAHPIVQAYSDGVAVMKTLPIHYPTSWTYQANIHGTNMSIALWPANAPFDTCEHGTLHFLPWHRMYLYFFERMIRVYSGNQNFALPYWNYSKAGQAALPQPFRTLAGPVNPLYDGTRSVPMNSGAALSGVATSTSGAMNAIIFSDFSGSVENSPHGLVHGAIGGNMGGFAGAGRDPIFWLHHCNVDRLWEAWLAQGRANPIRDTVWMGQTSEFVDEDGHFVTMVNADVLDTIAQLRYQYDDPRGCIPLVIVNVPFRHLRPLPPPPIERLDLASEVRLDLREPEMRMTLTEDARGKGMDAVLDQLRQGEGKSRLMLTFDSLLLDKPLNGYFEAYVSLRTPDGEATEPVLVGGVSTFGADRLSQESMMQAMEKRGRPHTMGVTTTLDVTDVVLEEMQRIDPKEAQLDVTLRAVDGLEESSAGLRGGVNLEANPVFREIRVELVPAEG